MAPTPHPHPQGQAEVVRGSWPAPEAPVPPASTGEAPGAAEISLVAPLSRVPCSLVPKISPGPVAEEVSWGSWTTASVLLPACPLPRLGYVGWPRCCRPQWCPVPVPIWRGWGLPGPPWSQTSFCPNFLPGLRGQRRGAAGPSGTLQVGVGCRGKSDTLSKTVVMTQPGFQQFHPEHIGTFLAPRAPGGPRAWGR